MNTSTLPPDNGEGSDMFRSAGLAGAVIGLGLIGISSASAQSGSFRGSCRDIDRNGPMLTAMCKDGRGEWRQTSIDMRDCGRTPIANTNGRLTCGGMGGPRSPREGGGGYGGDYGGGGRGYGGGPGYGGPPPYEGYGRPRY